MIEWRDVLSIEEGDDVTREDVDLENVVVVLLTYEEIVIAGSYTKFKALWVKYRDMISKRNGIINKN